MSSRSKNMRTTSHGKAKKQSKLMRFISIPFRSLAKARDFYMRGLEDCAGRVGGNAGAYASSQVHLPRSFSVNSSAGANDDENSPQLLRASSKKINVDNAEISNKAGSDVRRRVRPLDSSVGQHLPTTNSGRGMRSYSVGLKMGRIDEERASTFEEDDEIDAKADLYTRSRSYAFNNRNSISSE